MIKPVVKEVEEKLKATLEVVRHDLSTLRTGKANLAILEPVRVDYYGSKTALSQVANLAVPEARLLVIQPWDPKQISLIERAILEANLGLNPSNDGRVIRVPIPQLTEERRRELCKKAREMGEKGKVTVRHHRHEGRAVLEKLEKEKKISEDDREEGYELIQHLHDKYIEDIGKSVTHKEADIMEV